jgi:hypothetical protein
VRDLIHWNAKTQYWNFSISASTYNHDPSLLVLLIFLRSFTTFRMTRGLYYKRLGLYGFHSIQMQMAKLLN